MLRCRGFRTPAGLGLGLHPSHSNPGFDSATEPLWPHQHESHAQHAVGCQNPEGQCTHRGGDQHYSIHKIRHGSRFPDSCRAAKVRVGPLNLDWRPFCTKNPLEQFSQMFSKSMRLCVLTIGIPLRSRASCREKPFRNRSRENPRLRPLLPTRAADRSQALAKPAQIVRLHPHRQ